MLTARLHFADGREVDQNVPEGENLPGRREYIEDLGDRLIKRYFTYRAGQSLGHHVLHYDEVDQAEFIQRHPS